MAVELMSDSIFCRISYSDLLSLRAAARRALQGKVDPSQLTDRHIDRMIETRLPSTIERQLKLSIDHRWQR